MQIEVSLGSDFDMLILPGGARHIDKLMANPHTKRIITAMCALKKPIVAYVDGAKLIEGHEIAEGKSRVMSYDDAAGMDACAADMIAYFEANMPAVYEIKASLELLRRHL